MKIPKSIPFPIPKRVLAPVRYHSPIPMNALQTPGVLSHFAHYQVTPVKSKSHFKLQAYPSR